MYSDRYSRVEEKTLGSRVFFIILGVLLIVFISIPLARNMSKQHGINKEIEGLKREIGELDNKNKDLKKLIGYLESDQFVEEQARLSLNYKKEGEEMIVVKKSGVDEEEEKMEEVRNEMIYEVEGVKKEEEKEKISNYGRWVSYFFE